MARTIIRIIGMKKLKNLFIFIIYIVWNFSLSSKINLVLILDKIDCSLKRSKQMDSICGSSLDIVPLSNYRKKSAIE
jgi:hypothetical protein